jgi:itaconate CoA-transferase
MLEAMAEWMGFPMYFAFEGAEPPKRNGAGHATIYPYGPYTTADGGVFFGLQNDREWISFATTVLKRPDLAADPRFKGNAGRAEHRDSLEPVIVEILGAISTAEATARLESAGIATARVSDMAALWAHPQLAARDRWGTFASPEGQLPALKPVTGNAWQPRLDPLPALGEHTDSIIREFGAADQIAVKETS